jgi:hypothetical protein
MLLLSPRLAAGICWKPGRRRKQHGGRRNYFANDVPGNLQSFAAEGNLVNKGRAKAKTPGNSPLAGEGKVRPSKVARARELIAQPDYPPPEVIAAVAMKLAQEFPLPLQRRSF